MLFAFYGQAQDVSYRKSDDAKSIQIHYQWRDHIKKLQSIDFSIDKALLNQPFSNSTAYNQQLARQHIFIEMMKLAQSANPKEASISIRKLGTEMEYKVRGNNTASVTMWRNKLANAQEEKYAEYLYQNYYILFNAVDGRSGVKPDHVRFAQESTEPLRDIAQALYEQVPPSSLDREYVNIVLSWIQSIPYDTLENRLTSNGSGYSPPLALLVNNRGDCDSKTVLAAAILRSLFPKVTFNFVFLDNHALLAANFPHTNREANVKIGPESFLLMEPTGPAQFPAGQISPDSAGAIASGRYILENLN
jgi:transglutaminase-like putative cysteine protease